MSATASQFLEVLFFGLDKLTRPTLRNLCDPSDSAEYRRAYHLLRRWEERGLVERVSDARQATAVIYRLTARGKRLVQQDSDPRPAWDRPWDGIWRMFMFDLPRDEKPLRQMLWRWLRGHRFGYLQGSLWIRPEPVESLVRTLKWFEDNPEQFALLETSKVLGISDAALVAGAWDVVELNARYQLYLDRVSAWEKRLRNAPNLRAVAAVWTEERAAFEAVMQLDPLLPRRLWPASYPGEKALAARQRLRRRAVEQINRLI
jgi:DNA-binding transcriptional regulator PaaX